jgi:hypothetical protein
MAYNITSLKNDLSSILHGTTTNQITNLDGLIYRAARQVLMDCDPQETKRILPVSSNVFNGVWDYPCPTDLKGNKIIDISPQVQRYPNEVWGQAYNQAFDVLKNTNLTNNFTIQFNQMVKTIRINAPVLTAPTIINDANSTTSNGTWTAGSSASNLATDNVNWVYNGGSLSFDLAASGSTGYLENSTMTALDLTEFLNQGTIFLYTYLPDGSDFTNINIRLGSSSTAYYSINATVNQSNTAFIDGWNLISFPWANATTTGSPDIENIDYARITWTYNGDAQTAVRLDYITVALGSILNLTYYSKYMFRDSSTGAFQETVTSDNNLINLDVESFNLLTFKVCEYAVQQQQGAHATQYDGQYFAQQYKDALARYLSMYKSEIQLPQSTYYVMPQRNNITPKTRYGF